MVLQRQQVIEKVRSRGRVRDQPARSTGAGVFSGNVHENVNATGNFRLVDGAIPLIGHACDVAIGVRDDLIRRLGGIGAAKQVLKGKGTLKLSARDLFYTNKVSGNINFQNTQAYFRNLRDTRQVTISFLYRFGKPIKGAPQRRTGGSGDEQNRVKMGNGN